MQCAAIVNAVLFIRVWQPPHNSVASIACIIVVPSCIRLQKLLSELKYIVSSYTQLAEKYFTNGRVRHSLHSGNSNIAVSLSLSLLPLYLSIHTSPELRSICLLLLFVIHLSTSLLAIISSVFSFFFFPVERHEQISSTVLLSTNLATGSSLFYRYSPRNFRRSIPLLIAWYISSAPLHGFLHNLVLSFALRSHSSSILYFFQYFNRAFNLFTQILPWFTSLLLHTDNISLFSHLVLTFFSNSISSNLSSSKPIIIYNIS